jgi:hypothetical protein
VLVASPPNTQRAQLLTQELLKQDYVAPRLKSSLQKLYGRHHNVVDHYEMSISQITMDLYFLCRCFLSSITAMRFTGLDCIPPGFWMGSMLLIFFSFLCCPIMCIDLLGSLLWCSFRLPQKNDARFIFTSSCLLFVFASVKWCPAHIVLYFCFSSFCVP